MSISNSSYEYGANITDESEYDRLMKWNSEVANDRIPNSVILCLYIILGLVGNVAVIMVYHSRMKVKQENRYFILFLAELDLFAVLISASYTLYLNFNFVLPKGASVCKLFSFFSQATSITSCFVLLNIAVQRFRLVCRPMKKQLSRAWQKSLLAISVVCGSVLSIPVIVFYGESEIIEVSRNVTGYQCGVVKQSPTHEKLFAGYTLVLTFAFIAVLSAIGVLYVFILKSLKQRSSTMRKRQETRKRLMELSRTNTLDTSTDNLSESTTVLDQNVLKELNKSLARNIPKSMNEKHPRSSWIIPSGESRNEDQKVSEKKRKSSVSTIKSHFVSNKYSYIFLSITIFFTIAYVPTLVMISISSKEKLFWLNLSYSKLQIYLILRRMFIIDHIVNPLIYGYFDQSFRRQIKRLVCKVCRNFSSTSVNTRSTYSQTESNDSSR